MKTQDLSEEAFFQLLARLGSDPGRAGEAYERLRASLNFFFQRRGCRIPDELVDETINRIAHKIAMGHGIEDLIKFSHGVARLVLMEHWNDPGRGWEQLDDQFLSSEEDPEFDDPELTCMQKCLQSLSPEDQYLIVQNFTLDKSGKEELARAQGLSINAFRLRVFRIKTKLYECRRRCARKR